MCRDIEITVKSNDVYADDKLKSLWSVNTVVGDMQLGTIEKINGNFVLDSSMGYKVFPNLNEACDWFYSKLNHRI